MKQRPLNDILNECYERMADGQTLEYCLQIFPEQAEELRPLLEAKPGLDALARITPDPEFKTRAYYEMRNALETAWADKAPRTGFSWLRRLAMVTASLVGLVVVAGGGTVAGASGAMPDSALYSVKLFTEQTHVRLTGDEAAKAELYADLTAKRVDELDYLVRNQADAEDVNTVLTELDGLLASASVVPLGDDATATEKVSRSFGSGEPAPSPTQAPVAPTTTPTVTPTVTAPGPPSSTVVPSANADVTSEPQAAPAPTAMPSPEIAPVLLATDAAGGGTANLTAEQLAVISQLDMSRTELIAKLNAILQTAPESLRPLIQQAIANLEAGYDSAINNWTLPRDEN